jgi:pyruvate/2-oxoglutarate dehydrogenase complex dihydrolipoamide acyltransferase (E2) component
MNIVFTIDHRFGDAAIGVQLLRLIKDFIEDPENFKLDKYNQTVPYHLLS